MNAKAAVTLRWPELVQPPSSDAGDGPAALPSPVFEFLHCRADLGQGAEPGMLQDLELVIFLTESVL